MRVIDRAGIFFRIIGRKLGLKAGIDRSRTMDCNEYCIKNIENKIGVLQ